MRALVLLTFAVAFSIYAAPSDVFADTLKDPTPYNVIYFDHFSGNSTHKIPVAKQTERKALALCTRDFSGAFGNVVNTETITVSGCTRKVRMVLVDGPETTNKTGYGAAKRMIRNMCSGNVTVSVEQDSKQRFDRKGNIVGLVRCGGKSVNAALLYSGLAKVETKDCKKSEFVELEWAKECWPIINYTRA